MPATYEPIATTTAGGSSSTITFSSITASYTDLVLIINSKIASTQNILVQYNSDTGSNYSVTYLYGDGSSAVSGRISNDTSMYVGTVYAEWGMTRIQIQNYSNSTTYKTTLSRQDQAGGTAVAIVGLWRSTSAITSIDVKSGSGSNFTSGSTFTLYGIKAA